MQDINQGVYLLAQEKNMDWHVKFDSSTAKLPIAFRKQMAMTSHAGHELRTELE